MKRQMMGALARSAGVVCMGLCASLAGAASSEYPNGADGGDGNLDNLNGFFSENRQLDFDFLLSVFDDYIPDLLPAWNSGGTPLWTTVQHQEGPTLYGFDNNANGIVDSDHLDALAAIVDGGEPVAAGVAPSDIAAIQSAFNTNRARVKTRELFIPRATITAFSFITVSVDNVRTGANITVAGNNIYVPSLWTEVEIANSGNGVNGTTTDPTARGLLGDASGILEAVLRDYIAGQMTLVPAVASTEVQHIQSFMQVFISEFMKSQLPAILANAGTVTPRAANNYNTFDVDLDVDTGGTLGTIRVRIAGQNTGGGAQHIQQGINFFKNSFSPNNVSTTWTGAGFGSGTPAAPPAWTGFVAMGGLGSIAASGDLNRDNVSNAASFASALGDRQAFLLAEGITNPPLQFAPLPLSTTGILDGLTVLGDDEWDILGGDGSELAFDWETIDQLEYTFTDPSLGGDTSQSTYVMDATPLAQGGLYYSVQAADDTWTRTVPAFLLNLVEPEGEGVLEGEGALEGVVEGVVEGAQEGEGTIEGVVEGVLEGEGAVEGIVEGIIEGALEGEGTVEGVVEGSLEGEGSFEGEGALEGEGDLEGVFEGEGEVDPDCPGNLLRDGGLEAGDLSLRWGEDLMGDPSVLLYEDGEAAAPVYGGSFALLFYPRVTLDVIGVGQTINVEAGRPARLTFQMMITAPDVNGNVNISLDGEPVASVAASSLSSVGSYEPIEVTIPAQDSTGSALLSINNASLSGGGVVLMDAFCLTYADQQEGAVEGVFEGEGSTEGAIEGTLEGEGAIEGILEGIVEGVVEGSPEGVSEGEGTAEGVIEGAVEGNIEGGVEGQLEGQPEGVEEGSAEGEGAIEEGEDENLINIANALLQGFAFIDANGDGYLSVAELTNFLGTPPTVEELAAFDANGDERLQVSELLAITGPSWVHSADTNGDGIVSLSNLLRCVQIFNQGGYSCAANAGATEDGFLAIPGGGSCKRHALDYFGGEDGRFDLQELLRLIQIFNAGGYEYCPEDTSSEDGYCIVLP